MRSGTRKRLPGGGLAAASDDPVAVAAALKRLLDGDVAPLNKDRLHRYEHRQAAARYLEVLHG